MRPLAAALAAALAVAVAVAPRRTLAEEAAPLAWLAPDHAKVQLAGTIGFLSAGPGWAFARDRLELDLLAGWVPARYTGDDLFMVTGKLTWLPWRVAFGRAWRLRPVTASVGLTHTRGGRQLWVVLPDRYPRGYYELPSALRASVAVGGAVGRSLGSARELGAYWEVVANDVPLAYWIANRGAVRAEDVLSVAIGVRWVR